MKSAELCILAYLLLLYSCHLSAGAEKESRKFTTRINPDCESSIGTNLTEDCSRANLSLIHIQADGPKDSIHYLWSFIGAPSLLMARTPLNTNLTVDWAFLLMEEQLAGENPIKFTPSPFYVFGWSIVKIWFYDDDKDTGSLELANQSLVQDYDSKFFQWVRKDSISTYNSTMVNLTVEARSYDHREGEGLGKMRIGPDGFFRFTIRMKNTEDYSSVLPYMMYNANNTQVDIAFNDVQLNTTSDEYPNHPRVAFKYILVQDFGPERRDENPDRMWLEMSKTLDDEHSPGVFEVFSVKTPSKGWEQSYLEWRPICYTAEIRDVIDSVDVKAYPLRNASSVKTQDNVQDSILWSYFGPEIDNLTLDAMNISFGTSGDGFYNKTKHVSWTYTTGFGVPPADRVSMLVMLVVSIGLGIPAVIIAFSVIYMGCRRKNPRDELLLGHS